MSVQSQTSLIAYAGNNSTSTPYVVPFYFLANGDLVVVVTDLNGAETMLVLTTDYTVSGAAVPAGGSITTVAAVPVTSTVTIYRDPALTQTTTYADNDAFPAATHETALDKLTMMVQRLALRVSRSLRFTSASPSPAELPATGLTNRLFALDSGGNFAALTVTQAIALLSLSGTIQNQPTAFWADATARASKVPDFQNQFGLQVSDDTIWLSDGTTAGSWEAIPYALSTYLPATFANAAARAAAVPLYIGQPGFQLDTTVLYYATATSAGSWTDYRTYLGGQLGITAGVPDVRGIRETSGPTLLTLGAVADGGVLQRSGATLIAFATAAVHAHKNGTNQTFASGSGETLVTFGTETFDTASIFASNRLTPTTAGYYRLRVQIGTSGTTTNDNVLGIKKNGTTVINSHNATAPATTSIIIQVCDIIVLANGTTDYFEAYYLNGTAQTSTIRGTTDYTFFEAVRLLV